MSSTQVTTSAKTTIPVAVEAAEDAVKLVPYEAADPERKQKIDAAMSEIDILNTNSIIGFGSKAQTDLRRISQELLNGVRNKDTGQAGDTLNEMVLQIRGFDLTGLADGEDRGFFARIGAFFVKQITPLARAIQRYESVKGQIQVLQRDLEGHKTKLLRDIEMLDRQWDAASDYYNALAVYIAAGEEVLRRLAQTELPEAKRNAEGAVDDPMQAENYRRLEAAHADLERKVHDLKLTRQVILQAIPSIGLVQDNDTSLVTKIQSTVQNTIPLWEIQLSQALAIQNSREAAESVKAANDLTNDLLKQNAANLKQANAEIRTQIERGVFDIEAIEQANADLITTIEDSIQIAKEGRAKRQDAEKRLVECEDALRAAMLKADEARH